MGYRERAVGVIMPIIPISQLPDDSQSKSSNSTIIPIEQLPDDNSSSLDVTPEDIISARPSAIGLVDRAKLSFADDSGRQQVLRSKFKYVEKLENGKYAVGDNPKNLQPIDPEGMFNDVIGDLADVVSEIPILAGQIAGASSAAFGTGGLATVAGGAAGATVGGAVKVGTGQMLGVRKGDALEEATDIAINGAFGAVGEGLGQALKYGGKGLSGLAKNSFDRAIAKSTNPPKSLQMLGKVFKLTSAVDEQDVVEAGLYGFNESLSPKYMDTNYSRELMTKFARGVIIHDSALGKMVGKGDKWAVDNFGNSKVQIQQISQKLSQSLSNPRVGIIDGLGAINKEVLVEPADRKAIQGIVNGLFSKNPKTGGFYPKNMTVSEIIDFKKRSRPLLNRYFRSEGVNIDAKRAFAEYFDEVSEAVAKETSKLSSLPAEANPYVKANKAFSMWKKDVELLKANGLDIEDVSDLKDLFRGGKIVSQRLENFFERFNVKNSSAQQAFSQISDVLPIKFSGKGIGGTVGTLTDELRKYNAAQGFKNANPNFIRMASLTGMVGLNIGRDNPQGATLTGGAGLLFGTPAGVRLLLKGGESVGKNLISKSISQLKKTGVAVPRHTQRALLSRLIAMASSENGQQ